jgi:hypothetical protein
LSVKPYVRGKNSRTLTTIANVQVKTKITDFNLLLWLPSIIGAANGIELSDLMSSGCPMVGMVSDPATM